MPASLLLAALVTIMCASPRQNVLQGELATCCSSPPTGYMRDGVCRAVADDAGTHTVCAVVTDAFLKFTAGRGNDLSTPQPGSAFPGLKAGDRWCLCALRWREAQQAGVAPPVDLAATDARTLDFVPLEDLRAHAHGGKP